MKAKYIVMGYFRNEHGQTNLLGNPKQLKEIISPYPKEGVKYQSCNMQCKFVLKLISRYYFQKNFALLGLAVKAVSVTQINGPSTPPSLFIQ